MWSILPWQDWMSIDETLRHDNPGDERINVPSNPKHYWRYRMHMTIEELLKEKKLNQRIKMLHR
jgi:4-alpha-glucanotransferase